MDSRQSGARYLERTQSALARRFGIDARGLAAFRIALGLLLLADLTWRALDFVAFYTDAGVLPRAVLREEFPGFARISLHTVSGDAWVQTTLFLVAAVFAVSLVLGYRTTLVTVISWILLVSLHARNPILLNGGDSLLRRLLFWGIFLPLGERWSVDALQSRQGEPRSRIASVATAALLIQVVIVYTLNGIFKLRSDLWRSGDAILYVFELDQLTVFLGNYLSQFPTVLGLFDWVWLAMTLGSVLLVLLVGRARTLFVALFATSHLGMALTMRLGLFPLISIAGLLAFLPGSFWDAATRVAVDARVRVDRSSGRLERALASVGGSPTDGSFSRSDIGRWTHRVTSGIVACLLVLVLMWNAMTLGVIAVPDGVAATVDPEQHRWDMFANPQTADGWFVVPGELESGAQVDALRGTAVSWDRPPNVAATFPSHRWFVYLLDLRHPAYANVRPQFAEYRCQQWNDNHEDDLRELAVYYVEEPTRFDGPETTRRIELHQHSCSSGNGGS